MGALPLTDVGLKKSAYLFVNYSEHNTKFWKLFKLWTSLALYKWHNVGYWGLIYVNELKEILKTFHFFGICDN
jgi:hypothetical protein